MKPSSRSSYRLLALSGRNVTRMKAGNGPVDACHHHDRRDLLHASLVKGVTGMGLPTVAMGFWAPSLSPVAAAALLIAPSFVTNVWQLLAGPGFAVITRRLWPMMLAIIIGTVLGTSLLTSGDTDASPPQDWASLW